MKRFAALLSFVAFLASGTAEAAGAHRCPHHDGMPAAATDHAAHHATADHGPDDSASASHEGCTCMGACQPGGVATPVEATAPVTQTQDADSDPDGWWTPTAPRASHHPFELPPANGPPIG